MADQRTRDAPADDAAAEPVPPAPSVRRDLSFSALLAGLVAGLPAALVAVVGGVALIGAFQGSLAAALADERGREAAAVTFLATTSGMTLWGIGAAFWGLLLGVGTQLVLTARKPG